MSYLGSWKIDDLITFYCNTHSASTGAATDADSVPTYRVYEDETATPILTGSMALIDSANTAGFYSEQIQLTAASGFEKGKTYSIYITATVSSVAGTMSHSLQVEAEVDSNTVSASNVSANVAQWLGSAVSAGTAGTPNVDITRIANAAVSTSTAQLGVNVVNAAGTAWNSGAIGATTLATGTITNAKFAAGAIDAAAIAADAIGASELAADAVTEIRSLANGTSDAGGSTTTMVDAALTQGDTDYWKGQLIVFTSGTVAGQARLITGFNFTTDTVTFTPAVTQSVGAGITYEIWPQAASDLASIGGTAVSTSTAQLGVNVVNAGGTAWGSGAITNAAFAADAISAAKVNADVGTEYATAFWGTAIPGAFGAGTAGSRLGKLPDSTAGASGGVFIAGTNAATTITTALTTTFTGNLSGNVTGSVASVTGAVGSVTGNVGGNVTGSVGSVTGAVGSVTGLTPTTIAAGVLDEDMTAHQTAGTLGKAIGDPLARTNSLMQSVPDAVAGATGGLFIAGANAATSVTTALTANITGNLSGSVGSVTGAVGSVTGATGSVTGNVGGNVLGSVASIAAGGITAASFAADAITAAKVASDVSAEIAAAVAAYAGADPASPPAVNAGLMAKIDWLTAWARNKQTMNRTTGVVALRNDADNGTIGTYTASDDGVTFTRPEVT